MQRKHANESAGRIHLQRAARKEPSRYDIGGKIALADGALLPSSLVRQMICDQFHEEKEMNYDNRGTPGISRTNASVNAYSRQDLTKNGSSKALLFTTELSLFERIKMQLLNGFRSKGKALFRSQSYDIEIIPSGPRVPKPGRRVVFALGRLDRSVDYWTTKKTADKKLAQTSSNLG